MIIVLRDNRISQSFYHFLTSFPVTRGYVEKMAYRYRFISPCDSNFISRKTVYSCLLSWSICVFAFIIVFLTNPRLITLITAGVAVFIINAEVVGRMAKIFEITILQEIQKMISLVEHNYYVEYRVDDALYRSTDNLSSNMKKAAEQIYQLLLSDDKEEDLRKYYENVPSRFLRAFVSQCVGVMEQGNQIVEGKLLFIRNLESLQREIDIEIDKLQRLRMEFLGVIVCVVAPIFCIDFVKQFAVSIKENMEQFFYGKEGFLLDLLLLVIISCIYLIMRKSAEYRTFHQPVYRWLFQIDRIPLIKKSMDNYCEKNASKMERLKRELRNEGNNIRPRHFVLRSFLLSGMVLAIGISITFYLHGISKEQLIEVKQADMEFLTSAANQKQYESMRGVIEAYVNKYLVESKKDPLITIPSSKKAMISILEKDGTFRSTLINEALATEIMRRIISYNKEYFSLYDFLICLSLSIIAYYLPKVIMKYCSAVSRDAMEDEVNQFNASVCMLMNVDSITVKQILEELESFAIVFKQSLRICINNYSSGDLDALKELKEREPYEPFNRIVDNLIRCDDMPINQAFHEIDIERDGYLSKRKLANEKSIRKRVFRAYILAAIPFILLFSYGLVPTLISSINEINAMLEELNSSSW